MGKVSMVEFKMAKNLPANVRKVHGLSENDFVEIRVEGSIPSIHVEKIESPSKRVKKILEREGSKIML